MAQLELLELALPNCLYSVPVVPYKSCLTLFLFVLFLFLIQRQHVPTPRVVHVEGYRIPRIPAYVEFCIQADLDLEKYPTRRRTKPVYSIEGRIVNFVSVTEKDGLRRNLHSKNVDAVEESNLGT